MNDNDPIPAIPPRIDEFPVAAFLFPPPVVRLFGQYVQGAGGFVLTPGGLFSPGQQPPFFRATLVADLGAFILSQLTSASSGHQISQYIARLTLSLPPPDRTAIITQRPASQEPIALRDSTEGRRATESVVVALRGLQQAQDAAPVNVPQPQRFTAYRQGDMYAVSLGNLTVALCTRKKHALAMKNAGNAWLQFMQTMAVVDTNALLAQFTAYIAAASDPTGGFRPVMNTQIPNP